MIAVCSGTSSASIVCSSWSDASGCDAVLPFSACLRRFLSRADVVQGSGAHGVGRSGDFLLAAFGSRMA
eukprot:4693378-Lingulodinium_polyedra.AAC.1